MIHLFKSALARALTYLLMVVLAAGVLLGALRLAVPYADAYRHEVEALVGERVGLSVQLGALEVRLRGWTPQLRFRDARFLDPVNGRVQLAMDRLALDLDLPASLRNLAPQIGAVTLVGARLLVRRLADGRLLVAGIGADGGDAADLALFLRQGRLRLEEGELTWVNEGSTAPPLVLSGVDAWSLNTGDRHRFALRARGLAGAGVGLRLVGDLAGAASAPGLWEGSLYLAFTGADLSPLVRTPLPAGLHLDSRGVRLETWARLESGEAVAALMRLDLAGLRLTANPPGLPSERLELQSVGGTLDWQRLSAGSGWRLDVHDLALVHQGAAWSPTDLTLAWSTQGDAAWELRGGLRLARLGPAMALVRAAAPTLSRLIPLERLDAFDHLLEAHPDGALSNLAWRLTGGGQGPVNWAVRGRLAGLTNAAAGAIPGVRDLDLDFAADQGGGHLTLSGTGTTLDLPRLLREPLHLQRLGGDLSWRREPDGRVRIEVPELAADHAAVATRTALSLCLPPGGASPFLDLRGHFGNGDVTRARGLIPTGILKPDLVAWLDRAIVAGRVPSGAVLFRGNVDDFPFREGEGRLEVLFDARDGVLDYLPGWPRLSGVEGQLLFLNERMEIVLERARILDSAVTAGTATIDDLFNTRTLGIRATAEGPFADGRRVLREGPLARSLGRLAEPFEVGGDMRLGLDLSVPLRHDLPLGLEGRVDWPPGARIGLKGTAAELSDLSGTLRFRPDSVSSEGLEAELWGAPVRLDISTLGTESADRLTQVRARSTTSAKTLAERLESPYWSQVQGAATWELAVKLRDADVGRESPPIGFELGSDLKGLALRLPAPLGKPAGTSRALRLAGQLIPGTSLTLDATYDPQGRGSSQRGRGPNGDDPQGRGSTQRGREPNGDADLSTHLEFSGGPRGALRFAGGRVDLGGGGSRAPSGEGLWVFGSIPSLDGDAWRHWWTQEGTKLSAAPGPQRKGSGPLRGADLHIGRLILGGVTWEDLQLGVARGDGAWAFDFQAAQAAGTLRLPDDPRDQPIAARLTQLDVKALVAEDRARPTEANAPADPREAPGLDLEVERLSWGRADLGRLKLVVRPRPDGLEITDLSLRGPSGTAAGGGAWTQAGDDPPVSRLAVEGTTGDLGELLRRLDFATSLEHAPAQASLNANWPGSPGDFTLARVAGRISFEVGAGGMLEVEPGVGRMLGILNIGALQRRLTLDFSDLFAQGYRFEGITGDIALATGEARIDRFEIRGPAADIAVSGRTDLKARRFDQIATVTPKISTGVAVASAVVGGPLVGAAVYLVDRVSGGAIDNLGRYRYRIEGPWDAPQVYPVRGQAPASAADESGVSPSPNLGSEAPSNPASTPEPAARESHNPFLR